MKSIFITIVISILLPINYLFSFYAFASKEPTLIHSDPSINSTVLCKIPIGTKIELFAIHNTDDPEQSGDFIHIKGMSDGDECPGWVHKSCISFNAIKAVSKYFDFLALQQQYIYNKKNMNSVQFDRWWEKKLDSINHHTFSYQGYVKDMIDSRTIILGNRNTKKNHKYILECNQELSDKLISSLNKGRNVTFTGWLSSNAIYENYVIINFQGAIINIQ